MPSKKKRTVYKTSDFSGDLRHFTTGQMAMMFDVAPRTVSKWCDKGFLPGSFRIPGSQDRRVPRSSVLEFCKKSKVPIPSKLVTHRIFLLVGQVKQPEHISFEMVEIKQVTSPVSAVPIMLNETPICQVIISNEIYKPDAAALCQCVPFWNPDPIILLSDDHPEYKCEEGGRKAKVMLPENLNWTQMMSELINHGMYMDEPMESSNTEMKESA